MSVECEEKERGKTEAVLTQAFLGGITANGKQKKNLMRRRVRQPNKSNASDAVCGETSSSFGA